MSELRTGEMMAVTIGDDQVLLTNIEGQFHAIDDVCSHAYACLSDGDIDGEEAACPLHGGSFNAITGVAIKPPAEESLRVFQVKVEGDDIFVAPPSANDGRMTTPKGG
ncbi:MAG: ferredoxin [Chloroflexota bacterium]|nr:MAG: ferredoxin [Chloroflexota bacterium]